VTRGTVRSFARVPAAFDRSRRLLIVLLVTAVATALATSGMFSQKTVTVITGDLEVRVKTSAGTVREVLEAAGLPLGPRDEVSPPPEAPVEDGLIVVVRRAVPVVVEVDGREYVLMTTARTVGELIATSRLRVGPDDRLEPGRDAEVKAGLRLVVTRVVKSYQHREEEIPFRTIRREDMTMDLGRTVVVQRGRPGLRRTLLRVTYEDGRETEVEVVSTTVVREPVPEVVRVGTAGTIVRDGQTIRFLKALKVTATAYEPGPISCGAWADGYTCLGLRATKGIIAVDPAVIPLWSRVYVDGYGFAVAGDVGSAIKGHRIDVCYDTYAEAISWGVRRVMVYILELPGS